MKLLLVSGKNLFSYGEFKQPLDLQGMFLVSGPKGSGKSSRMIDAITWCLYDKTPRGYHGDDVINSKYGKDCFVLLIFQEGKVYREVIRFRKHTTYKNSLFYLSSENIKDLVLNPETTPLSKHPCNKSLDTNQLTQEKVNTVIGVDYSTFVNSVLFSQKVSRADKRFTEMTDSELVKIFEQLWDIDKYDKAKKVISEQAKELIFKYTGVKNQVDSLHSKIQSNKAIVDNLKESIKQTNELEITEKIQSINKKIELLQKEIISYEANNIEEVINTEIEKLEETLQKSSSAVSSEINECKITLSTLQTLSKELFRNRGFAEAKVHNLNKDLDFFTKNKQCVTCKQSIQVEYAEKQKQELELFLSKLDKELSEIDQTVKATNKKITNENETIDNKTKELSQINTRIREEIKGLNQKKADALANKNKQHELSLLTKSRDDFISFLTKEKDRINDINKQITKLQDGISADNEALTTLQEELLELENLVNHYVFWEKAISVGKLKAFLFSKILPMFNNYLDYYSTVLTNGEAVVKLSTKKQLKSGEDKSGFVLDASFCNGAQNCSGASGGERTLIDLIISLAIRKADSDKSGKNFNILIGDEPFVGLGEDDIELVMKELYSLNSKIPSIFIIGHDLSLKQWFTNVINVTKEDGVSKAVLT